MNIVYKLLIVVLIVSFITGIIITVLEKKKRKAILAKRDEENKIIVEENPENIIENEISELGKENSALNNATLFEQTLEEVTTPVTVEAVQNVELPKEELIEEVKTIEPSTESLIVQNEVVPVVEEVSTIPEVVPEVDTVPLVEQPSLEPVDLLNDLGNTQNLNVSIDEIPEKDGIEELSFDENDKILNIEKTNTNLLIENDKFEENVKDEDYYVPKIISVIDGDGIK